MNPKLREAILIAGVVLILHLILALLFPTTALHSFERWGAGLGQILLIVPAVLVLLGLFDAWVPRGVIERGLGPDSGMRGVLLALLLGTGAAGPLYAAFPIGIALRDKGARTANLVIFLGAWATIKLPMLMMESAFLGMRFALLRLALTLPGLVATGFLIERLEPRPAPRPLHAALSTE